MPHNERIELLNLIDARLGQLEFEARQWENYTSISQDEPLAGIIIQILDKILEEAKFLHRILIFIQQL